MNQAEAGPAAAPLGEGQPDLVELVQANQGVGVGVGLEGGRAAGGHRDRLAALGKADPDELGEAVVEQGLHVREGVG